MKHMSCVAARVRLEAKPRLEQMENRITPAPVCYDAVLTNQHADLGIAYHDGAWDLHIHNETDDAEMDPAKTALSVGAQAEATRPVGAQWDFLGVGAGSPLWILPQAQNPNLLFLGFGAEETEPGTFLSYFEADPRVNAAGAWTKATLADVRGPGHFSVYQTDLFGVPTVWMASADGITEEDAVFLLEGSHAHYNFAFTHTGIYEIDIRASAFLPDGTPTESEVVTFYFAVVTEVTLCEHIFVTGTDAGGPPHVKVFNAETREEKFSFFAYDPGFLGGVRVAVGDVNGDGVADIITGIGAGAQPHVKVFSGIDGSELYSFFAFEASFQGGIFVAAGDVNHDGHADIIVGADAGAGPHVKVFSGANPSVELFSFFAFAPGFLGGVRVAAGDVTGDHHADIIVGAGPGAGPHVRIFSGETGQQIDGPLGSFFAFDPGFDSGLVVASGHFNNDQRVDVVVGAGVSAGPHIKVFDGVTRDELASFFAFDPTFLGGVRVATGTLNDGTFLFVGTGPGINATVRAFDNAFQQDFEFSPYPGFSSGVFIGGN